MFSLPRQEERKARATYRSLCRASCQSNLDVYVFPAPLPNHMQAAKPRQSCGETIIDNYRDLSKDAASNILRQLRLLSVRQIYQQAASQQSQRKRTSFSFRGLLASFTSKTTPKGQLPQHEPVHQKGNNLCSGPCDMQTQTNQHEHHFIHWCIPWSRYAIRMSALQSCKFKTDVDFFRALKQRYEQSKKRYKRLLSFKKATALRFVKASSSHALRASRRLG